MKNFLIITFIALFAISSFAQTKDSKKTEEISKASAIDTKSQDILLELANATLKAHGGDKFKNMTSLTVIGSVDVTPSNFPQKIPATFVSIFSGEKYRFELNNPFQPIKQIFDGEQTLSNAPGGFEMPPVNRLGMPMIQRIGQADFVVSGLADDKEFKKGFRITSPEGFYTDFIIDKKTGRVKSYTSSYIVRGNSITTAVEIDKFREVDGIVVPEKYAQRFDLGQMTVYADFKAKEILVNNEIKDDVFTMN